MPNPLRARWIVCLPLAALLFLACDDESRESIPDASQQASTTGAAPTAPSRTPIADEILLTELRSLPAYEGSRPGDPAFPEGSAFSGAAGRDFTVSATVDEILAFYEESLLEAGWASEGEPHDQTYPIDGANPVRVISWAFVKGDMRLQLAIDPTPKGGAPGEIDYGLGVQPIWFPVDEHLHLQPRVQPQDKTPDAAY
jgi:hypothetical protein